MNVEKIIYWIATGIMCALFAFSAFMYFSNTAGIQAYFEGVMGFPSWVVIPLAIAKVLGIIAVLTKQSQMLKEWAYAGFFFDALLASGAHYHAGHGLAGLSMVALVAVLVSRFMDGRVFGATA